MTTSKPRYNEANMAGAMMDAVRMIRADDRLDRLPPGSRHRREILQEIVKTNADYYGVDVKLLGLKLVEALDSSDNGYCRERAREDLRMAEKTSEADDNHDDISVPTP